MNSEIGGTLITRPRAIAYAAIIAVELVYMLRMNLPQLWPPQPSCGLRGINDVCVVLWRRDVLLGQTDYLSTYEVHQVGGPTAREYWIPAGELDAFNAAIVGSIDVVREYRSG